MYENKNMPLVEQRHKHLYLLKTDTEAEIDGNAGGMGVVWLEVL